MGTLHHLINGEMVADNGRSADVFNPSTGEAIHKVPLADGKTLQKAIDAARAAFPAWRNTPPAKRAQVLYRFKQLLEQNEARISKLISEEHGKTLEDAAGELKRGIENVEYACAAPEILKGEYSRNVGPNIDAWSDFQPIGVVAGITPFNFPAMVPLWMYPLAIACGNTFVLKPSEQDPLTPNRLAELFLEAGAPKGVLQVIHGGREQVDALLTHPDIRAISFVGSVAVGQHVYRTGTAHLKRVQAFAGAKNHMVILPDANKAQVLGNLVGASCGAAGQRCMAISAAVFVGAAREWIPELAERMAALRPGHWQDPDAAYGPLISPQARQRVLRLIAEGKAEGAECLLDGSQCQVEGYPNGNWLGPTLFRAVTPKMGLYREEIFGPVLACLEVDTLEEAIALVNANPYGNGTSLFTRSGGAARRYQHAVQVGQVGINVPIPVPLPFFSFTGWKGSFYGDLHAYGKQAVRFYTETKTVTSRWFDDEPTTDESSAGPNMTIHLK